MRLPKSLPYVILLLGGVLASGHTVAGPSSVSFHIADETDPSEVTEATTVFINGHLVAGASA